MYDNISYLEDEVEIARISMPSPPAAFLAPPAFLETAQDKVERQRQQKPLDEARKRNKDKYDEAYQDDFAKDFLKDIAHHFAFLQGSIVTDLERTIEHRSTNDHRNGTLSCNEGTTAHQIRAQLSEECRRAEETRRKLDNLHGDHRGWDVYLAAPQLEIPSTTPSKNPYQADHIYPSHRVRLH